MKILVVDDSKTMRHVVITELKEIGYEDIIEADCVEKAKPLIMKDSPQLIISDWNMPGGSGLDLLRFVRGNPPTSQTPFIMLTTETDRNKIVEATKAGLQSYLLKPIRKPVLIEKLNELAEAYGFQLPVVAKPPKIVTFPKDDQEPAHPLKGKINKESVEKIAAEYEKVLETALTSKEFTSFLAKESFGGTPEDKAEDVKILVDATTKAALDAVKSILKQVA